MKLYKFLITLSLSLSPGNPFGFSLIYIFYKERASTLIKFFSLTLFPCLSLVYVNERKIERGQHNVFFNCELFNERFIEYCFVYVTEAKSGAVADIRSDCVPTSPVYGEIKSLETHCVHRSRN
jgi:hypothetical protein